MKKFLFVMIFFLSLVSLVACDPNKNDNQADNQKIEKRDENGHLEKIEYYSKGTLYKTEYYEYLNKHDDESQLVKTVENDQVTFEMEECWKIAYCLQNNTYKLIGEISQVYNNRTSSFSELNGSKMTITTSHAGTGVYDINTQTYTMDFDTDVQVTIQHYDYENQEYSTGLGNDGNLRVYKLQ